MAEATTLQKVLIVGGTAALTIGAAVVASRYIPGSPVTTGLSRVYRDSTQMFGVLSNNPAVPEGSKQSIDMDKDTLPNKAGMPFHFSNGDLANGRGAVAKYLWSIRAQGITPNHHELAEWLSRHSKTCHSYGHALSEVMRLDGQVMGATIRKGVQGEAYYSP